MRNNFYNAHAREAAPYKAWWRRAAHMWADRPVLPQIEKNVRSCVCVWLSARSRNITCSVSNKLPPSWIYLTDLFICVAACRFFMRPAYVCATLCRGKDEEVANLHSRRSTVACQENWCHWLGLHFGIRARRVIFFLLALWLLKYKTTPSVFSLFQLWMISYITILPFDRVRERFAPPLGVIGIEAEIKMLACRKTPLGSTVSLWFDVSSDPIHSLVFLESVPTFAP